MTPYVLPPQGCSVTACRIKPYDGWENRLLRNFAPGTAILHVEKVAGADVIYELLLAVPL